MLAIQRPAVICCYFTTMSKKKVYQPRNSVRTQEDNVAHTLLAKYEEKGTEFLLSIVTADEIWVYYFAPECKRAPMEWRHPLSPKPKKQKQCFQREMF